MENHLLRTIETQLDTIDKELNHSESIDPDSVVAEKKHSRPRAKKVPFPGLSANQKKLRRALGKIQGMRL